MIGHFFALAGFAFIGPVVSPFMPFLSTEVMSVVYAGEMGLHPLWVGLATTLGQNMAFCILYPAGATVVDRWARLRKQIDWLRARYSGARRTFFLTTLSASFFGVPPMLPMVLLARSFGMRLGTLLAISIPLRAARFAVLAALGGALWPSIMSLWQRIFG